MIRLGTRPLAMSGFGPFLGRTLVTFTNLSRLLYALSMWDSSFLPLQKVVVKMVKSHEGSRSPSFGVNPLPRPLSSSSSMPKSRFASLFPLNNA